jgi:hypothetical protein
MANIVRNPALIGRPMLSIRLRTDDQLNCGQLRNSLAQWIVAVGGGK